MKKFVTAGACAIFVLLSASLFVCHKQVSSEDLLSDVSKNNIEALTQPEVTYYRANSKIDGKCTVSVGAKGKIQLLGGTILKADSKGNVSFDGQVTCVGTGDVYCRPVECIDLYSVVLSK